MTGSVALDVAIGLVFIYLLYSLLATIVQEIIATFFSMRASNLEKAIKRMLEDGSKNENILAAFYNHPIVKFLGEDEANKKKPSYIKAETFSKVMIDLLKGNGSDAMKPGADIRPLIQDSIDKGMIAWNSSASAPAAVNKIEQQTILYLRSIWADAQGDVDRFRKHLENWFNETMDRASGWYKKKVQLILFFTGLLMAVFFNINTIDIAKKLEKDPTLRAQVVAQADAYVKAHPNLEKEYELQKSIDKQMVQQDTTHSLSLKHLDSLNELQYRKDTAQRNRLTKQAAALVKNDISSVNHVLALGWSREGIKKIFSQDTWTIVRFFLLSLIGWIITALAISLGAPFWFDLLNKLMQIRSSLSPEDAGSAPAKTDNKQADTINRKG